MRKIIVSLVVGCLIMVISGCSGSRGSSMNPPKAPQGQQAATAQLTTNQAPGMPATTLGQPAEQTGNQEILFTHQYSPGHSYRITLPGDWRGKYSVKETKNQSVEDLVTFYFYKPFYLTVRAGSDQKVAEGGEAIFGICTETESQREKEKQDPGYGIELASRDGLVFVLESTLSNEYQGADAAADAAEYNKLAEDAWLRIGKTFEFVDGN